MDILEKYNFDIPKELIAQEPVYPRDECKLMVLKGNDIEHRIFKDIINYMEKGDVLVLNNSKVIRARLFGKKSTGGKVELLLIEKHEYPVFLVKGKNIKEGTTIEINEFKGKILEKNGGIAKIDFGVDIEKIIEKYGRIPIPPYIKKDLKNPEMYQTVYSAVEGSVAAPTAGLHFTEELLKKIKEKGVEIQYLTLHISYSTFKQLEYEEIVNKTLHEEYYHIPEETAEKINNRKGRLFAVGTTVVRALESSSKDNIVFPGTFKTNLFIMEGHKFQSGIDAIITNFHIPKSSLIMLVTAFGGYERVMNAYKVAIENKYRFYSFGDAMLIFKNNI